MEVNGLLTCSGCSRERVIKVLSRNLCGTCYNKYLDNKDNDRRQKAHYDHSDCILESCDKPRLVGSYCAAHGHRLQKHGDPLAHLPIRKQSGRIQRISRGGNAYWALRMPDHPLASKDGYVFEHRFIMYEAGLLDDPDNQFVHHKDHDGLNNDFDNLEVVSASQHRRTHQMEDGTINQFGHFPPRPDICIIDGCSLKRSMLDMCSAHGTRLRRYGDPLLVKRVGPETVYPYTLIDS